MYNLVLSIYFINSSHFQITVIQFQYLFQFHVRVSMWNYLVSTICHNGAEAKSLLLTIAKSSTDLEGGPGGGGSIPSLLLGKFKHI